MRNADQIIDEAAAKRQMVTPVLDHMAVGPGFVRDCLAAQLADVVGTLKRHGAPAKLLAVIDNQAARDYIDAAGRTSPGGKPS